MTLGEETPSAGLVAARIAAWRDWFADVASAQAALDEDADSPSRRRHVV